jgi:multicomponent Na+:H+ antiporter subunit G
MTGGLLDLLRDGASWLLVGGGAFFLIVGGIGILRLPDFYARLHAAGVTDTGGAILILLGLMIQSGLTAATVKLALVLFFFLITSPTSAHALANAAFSANERPRLAEDRTGTAGSDP